MRGWNRAKKLHGGKTRGFAKYMSQLKKATRKIDRRIAKAECLGVLNPRGTRPSSRDII